MIAFQTIQTTRLDLRTRLIRAFAGAGFLVVLLCAVCASGQNSARESTKSNGENEKIFEQKNDGAFPGFRYWKIPADSIDRWPWGAEKYYPIRVETFKEWLDANQETERLRDEESILSRGVAPSLELDAKLVGECLDGVGVLKTRFTREETSSSKELGTALYRLREFSFATSPSSENDDVLLDSLGVYADGRFYLPNSNAKERPFLWSQRGKSDKQGIVEFELVFPNSTRTQLRLETSAQDFVSVSNGVVCEITNKNEQTSPELTQVADDANRANEDSNVQASAERRVWMIYFGGQIGATLKITRESDDNSGERQYLGFQQESSYRLSKEGLELTARFEFERLDSRPEEVAVLLQEPLKLLSIEWGALKDADLKPKFFKENDLTKIVVSVPQNVSALDDLKINAFSALIPDVPSTNEDVENDAETTRGAWKLPAVRLEENELVWKETIWRIGVERPIVAVSTLPVDAAQAREAFQTRQENVDSLTYKLFEPTGGVELELRRMTQTPEFDSATDCLVVANDVTAKTTLFFNFNEKNGARALVPIARDWRIDSALSSDESMVWECVDEEGNVDAFDSVNPNANSKPRFLSVAFKNTSGSGSPTRVVLSARRIAPFENAIDVETLCPIDLVNNLRGAHALNIRTESPYQIKLSAKSGRPYTAPKVSPNFVFGESTLREALPASLGGSRLYFGPQTVDAVASLEDRRSNYATTGSCVCSLGLEGQSSSKATLKWRLHCEPVNGARVERILFFASASSENNDSDDVWKWSTATEPDRFFNAVKIQDEDAFALRAPKDAAVFEIRFETSKSVPFDVNLIYEVVGSSKLELPLLFLPESTNASFEVVLESSAGCPFWTDCEGLLETTTPIAQPNQYEALKKAFRYDPNVSRNSLEARVPTLNVAFTPAALEDLKNSDEEQESEQDGDSVVGVLPFSAWCWFETMDSFYEVDGNIRNRIAFYIENHGRSVMRLTLPTRVGRSAIRGIWIDERRAAWRFDNELNVVLLPLPVNRRYLTVVVEFQTKGPNLAGGRRLTPDVVEPDLPTLSSLWNAWTPPQYQTGRDSRNGWLDERIHGALFRSLVSFFTRAASEDALGTVADRFVERFGNENALVDAVAKRRAAQKKANAGTNAPIDPLTWGDVFADPAIVDQLFLPAAKSKPDERIREKVQKIVETNARVKGKATDSENDEKSVDSPANNKIASDADVLNSDPENVRTTVPPFALYIDRLGTASVAVNPSTPLPSSALNSRVERASQLLERAGLALLILDENSALLTTTATLIRANNVATVELRGSAILRCQYSSDAKKMLDDLASNAKRRYLTPALWASVDELVSPWSSVATDENTNGWNRASTPLARANDGVYVVNRYLLWALELFCFISFITVAWISKKIRPRVCVAVLGISLALMNVVVFDALYALRGLFWGAFGVLAFHILYRFIDPDSLRPIGNGLLGNKLDNSKEKDDKILNVVFDDSSDDSTLGFVDFTKMSPEERRSIQEPDGDPGKNKRGSAKIILLFALIAVGTSLLAFAKLALVNAQENDAAPTVEKVQNEPSDALENTAATPNPQNGNTQAKTENERVDLWQEPYRVFVPLDKNKKLVGEYYWVGAEFYEKIKQSLKSRPKERNWRVVDAKYEGAVNYNSLAGLTTLFNLKATYTIVMDSPNATISLPVTPLAPDVGAKFDRQTIATEYEEQDGDIYFEIEGAAPGVHSLELTLAPPQFSETTSQLSLPILKVPSSRLELSVPVDAPFLDVPNAQGKIERAAGRLVAELGAVDRLVIEKKDAADRVSKTTLDVEQLFLLRLRSNQTDVRSIFHYQASGGKIKTLDVECDPLFAFSGYCKCDEAEIESVDLPTAQNNAVHITFKEPVGGAFTLNINFVARNFSGVGRLSFPKISTLDARSVKSWLGVAISPDVVCASLPETSVTNGAFLKAWGKNDDSVEYAYDLSILPKNKFLTPRVKIATPSVVGATTFTVGASETTTRLNAILELNSELFRLTLETPSAFVVDSVQLTDENDVEITPPEFFQFQKGLTLVFQNPIKGTYKLRVVGRFKVYVNEKMQFPFFRIQDAQYDRRYVRIYCDSDVYLDWKRPNNWNPIERGRSEFGAEPDGDYSFVGAYEIGSENESSPGNGSLFSLDSSQIWLLENDEGKLSTEFREDNESNPPSDDNGEEAAIVRVNAPKFVGVERSILYQNIDDPKKWLAYVEFQFDVQNGRADRFMIVADEAFDWKFEDSDGNYDVEETTTYLGVRAIAIAPKKTIEGTVNVRLTATFKNEPENIRLPRFQLTPASPREDVASVRRIALLPERQGSEELHWATQDMRELVVDHKKKNAGDPVANLTLSTAALVKLGAVDDSIVAADLPDAVVKDSGMALPDFRKFERGNAAGATLNSSQDVMTISRAVHSFYLNSQYKFFGTSNFTIRPSEERACVIVAPENYEILEATVNGSHRLVERLDERRWRVDLDSTPYVKRLEISFQGVTPVAKTTRSFFGLRKVPVFNVDFLRVENAAPERVLWFCAFESLDSVGARWRVCQRGERDGKELGKIDDNPLNVEREPVKLIQANELIFRLCVEEATALLEAYENDLSRASGDDLPRLRAWWDRAWKKNRANVEHFTAFGEVSDLLSEPQRRALYVVRAGAVVDENSNADDPTSRWNFVRYRETMEQKAKLDDAFPCAPTPAINDGAIASPQSLWTYDVGDSTRMLVGAADSNIEGLVLTASAKSFDWIASRYAVAAFFLAITVAVLYIMKKNFRYSITGLFVVVWIFVCFVMNAKWIGLIGALVGAGAIGAFAVARRRLGKDLNKKVKDEPAASDGSSIEPALVERKKKYDFEKKKGKEDDDSIEQGTTIEIPQEKELDKERYGREELESTERLANDNENFN